MHDIIVPFVPRAEIGSAEQMRAYISHVRATAKFFKGPNAINWDADSWDLTPFFPARANVKTKAIFAAEPFGSEPFPLPFLDEAKAIVADFLQKNKTRSASKVLNAIRAIYRALILTNAAVSITVVDDAIIEVAAKNISEQSRCPHEPAKMLQRLVDAHLQACRLTWRPLTWKSSFKFRRPNRSNMVTSRQKIVDSDRLQLPKLNCILGLASIFRTSEYPADQIVTAWFAIAMAAPSRIAEILTLPVNCITSADMDGDEIKGLLWEPVKGGMPLTKFGVSRESFEVVSEAVNRLIDLGAKARVAASWYDKNPSQLFLPKEMEALRGQPITLFEISKVLGGSRALSLDYINTWKLKSVGNTTDRDRGASQTHVKLYDFSQVEEIVLRLLPQNFPVADPVTNLLYSRALFTMPYGIMKEKADTWANVPQIITPSIVGHDLGKKPNGLSIFARHNLIDPVTGKPWKLKTHQPRHFLNTLAQSKYLSQELIAFWSGRKDLRHNDYYDHLAPEAKLEAWALIGDAAPGQLKASGSLGDKVQTRATRDLQDEDEVLRQEISAYHKTQYGYCRHNFALTPCPKDKWCNNCGEAFFQKGNEEQVRSTVADIGLTKAAIERCRQAIEEGEGGVEDWLDRHLYDLERYETKLAMLNDPSIEDGTLLTLPPPRKSQSKVGLSFKFRRTPTQ